MIVNVRVNGVIAQKMGVARLSLALPGSATMQDLREMLQLKHPELSSELGRAVTVVGGTHQPATAVLVDGQEVALLLPIAGG